MINLSHKTSSDVENFTGYYHYKLVKKEKTKKEEKTNFSYDVEML
jgi:hypothetical protein